METLTGPQATRRPSGRSDRPAIFVRHRATGELFRHLRGTPGGAYDRPVRVGDGFFPADFPHLAIGDFRGDGTLSLLCGLPGGGEALLGPSLFFAAGDVPSAPRVSPGERPAPAQLLAVTLGDGGPDLVLRRDPAGTVHSSDVDGRRCGMLPRVGPADVLLGLVDLTGSGRPDLLVRRPDGAVNAFERTAGGGLWHDLGADFDDTLVVSAGDLSGSGLADLLAVNGDGDLLVFPHSGVFWPQDPAASFLCPVPVVAGFGSFDVIG